MLVENKADKASFNQRFGLEQSSPIDCAFPKTARIALAHLLTDLSRKRFLTQHLHIYTELARTGRFEGEDAHFDTQVPFPDNVSWALLKLDWEQVYIFCERVYEHLLVEATDLSIEHGWTEEVTTPLLDVREHYTNELNAILDEENVTYYFSDGRFRRRGRAHTQESIRRVGLVLTKAVLSRVRNHYNKAVNFFRQFPSPDAENCVKEALCALEAVLEILSSSSTDFAKAIKRLQGHGPQQIPPPIAQGMIKLHGYRGGGRGVAHAALSGNKVTDVEAELVLSLAASYITYLVDLLSQSDEHS